MISVVIFIHEYPSECYSCFSLSMQSQVPKLGEGHILQYVRDEMVEGVVVVVQLELDENVVNVPKLGRLGS